MQAEQGRRFLSRCPSDCSVVCCTSAQSCLGSDMQVNFIMLIMEHVKKSLARDQEKESMLRYASKEVDRLKDMFKSKEAALCEERSSLAKRLAECQTELASLQTTHQSCSQQAAEAAARLKVRLLDVRACQLQKLFCLTADGLTDLGSGLDE